MNLATIGGLLCTAGAILGQADNTPVIQAEVVDGRPLVQTTSQATPAAGVAAPSVAAPATPANTEPKTETPTVVTKRQQTVRFVEYQPKKKRRGLVEKMLHKLGHDSYADEYAGTIIVEKALPAPGTEAAAQQSAPNPASTAEKAVAKEETTSPISVAAVQHPTEAKHGADYSWIQGRLQKVHTRGGAWIVRYAPLDMEDVHGGSVVLVRDRRLEDFKEGDFVHIDGEILDQRSGSTLGGPLYRVNHIALLQAAAEAKSFK